MNNLLIEENIKEVSNLPIKLLYATKSKYEENWHSTMHMHPFTEIFYVVKGKGLFKVENQNFEVKEDDLIIVNSNITHTEASIGTTPLEYIVIGFEGMSLIDNDTHNQDLAIGYSQYNYKAHKNEIAFFIKLILEEVNNKERFHKNISQNLLQILILNIMRCAQTKQVIAPTTDLNKECQYIKKYIDINYSSEITLDSLSALVFINKYSLIRDFKKYVGTSPIDYLIQKRLEVSKNLLETTDYTMMQIALIVGFSSQSYFNQVFRKRVGITPSNYRDKIKDD